MKRCSQCDFIYEDDQHLCDMDGHELVDEPTLQHPHISAAKSATEPAIRPENSRVRHQALAAAVAVLIATILSVAYSGFTREYAPPNTKAPTTNFNPAPQPAPDRTLDLPAVTPTPAPSHSPRSDKTRVTGNQATPLARYTPSYPATAARRDTVKSQPMKANHKKESKIGGFLKKTGRILKKPFKF